ncbi:WD40-repeat-containing domain protein [Obelidium mucronatum]|nr:WD40-repeat-containing domain protein [Obelidium mucronatum]
MALHLPFTARAPAATAPAAAATAKAEKRSAWVALVDAVFPDNAHSGNSESAESTHASVERDVYAALNTAAKSLGSAVEAGAAAAAGALAGVIDGKIPFLSSAAPEKHVDANMSAIKALAWHPHKPLLAVLHRQDIVFIYDLKAKAFVGKNQGMLVNANMNGASCLEWMPMSGNVLAVGTKTGVCVWKVFLDQPSDSIHFPLATTFYPDASVMAASTYLIRPSSNIEDAPATPPRNTRQTYQQQRPNNSAALNVSLGQPFLLHNIRHPSVEYVSSLCFSPDAQLLYIGCATTGGIAVVDMALGEVVTHIPKVVGKATRSLTVSGNGRYLVQVCKSKFLRIWWTETMTSVDLACGTGPCFRDAQWMPDSKTLLLATDGAVAGVGCVSALQITGGKNTSYIMHPHPCQMPTISTIDSNGRQNASIGGIIKSMQLDPKGRRLAVTFENPTSNIDNFALGRDLVCFFDVKLAPHLILSEIGQVGGPNWDDNVADANEERPPRYPRSVHPDLQENQIPGNGSVTMPAGPRPLAIGFSKSVVGLSDEGNHVSAVLGAGWENGDISFVPLYF